MSVWSVDITLVHKRERDSILLVDSFLDLLVWIGLLVVELITRESNYLEAPIGVFFMHLKQSEIVLLGKGSVRGYVDDNCRLFVFHVFAHRALDEVDVSNFNGPQLFYNSPNVVRIFALFPCGSEAHTGLRVAEKYPHL